MRLTLTTLLLLACSFPAWAQTNGEPTTPPPSEPGTTNQPESGLAPSTATSTETNTPALTETHIHSDSVELGIKSRSAVYRGNVRLVDPRIELTCEQLSAYVPEQGKRVEKVVAETNVVITAVDEKGITNRAYADRAVYTYQVTDAGTNEVVELTGASEPHIERPEGDLYGNPIIWDRSRNHVVAKNQRMVYRGDPSAVTNLAPKAGTNASLEQLKAEALKATTDPQPAPPNKTHPSDE